MRETTKAIPKRIAFLFSGAKMRCQICDIRDRKDCKDFWSLCDKCQVIKYKYPDLMEWFLEILDDRINSKLNAHEWSYDHERSDNY